MFAVGCKMQTSYIVISSFNLNVRERSDCLPAGGTINAGPKTQISEWEGSGGGVETSLLTPHSARPRFTCGQKWEREGRGGDGAAGSSLLELPELLWFSGLFWWFLVIKSLQFSQGRLP